MTYEYLCTACGNQWEAEQRISEDPLTKCPKCGKSTAKRQVSGGSGFVLKGGGWYADLYSSSGAKPDPAKGDEPSEKKSEAKDTPSEKSASKASDKASGAKATSKKNEASAGKSSKSSSSD